MYFAHAAALTPRVSAPTIQNPWRALSQRGIGFRRGELTMLAGPPGSGKSSVALSLAVQAGVPALYLSSDTTRETTNLRLIQMLTSISGAQAEEFSGGDPLWASQILSQARHISFDDNSAPTVGYIESLIEAYIVVHGIAPELLVVDNLADVVIDEGDGGFMGLKALTRDLREFARTYQASVLVLHHTREVTHQEICPPQWTLSGKVSEVPALILTINGQHTPGLMAISAVKNRWAKPDGGADPAWLSWNPEVMELVDLNEAFEVVA